MSGLRAAFARVVCGDMELSVGQRERVAATLEFARTRLSPGARERDRLGTFDRTLWREAAEFGLTGLPIPESLGGRGLDVVDAMLVVEALGKGCEDGGLVFSLCAHTFAAAVPIWRSRSQEHQARFLRDVAQGTLICASVTPEEAGSEPHALRCEARRVGGDYVLHGRKAFVTNAPVADLFLVYATTSRERGALGVSAFLLPRDTRGLRVVQGELKSGLRTSPWGSVQLDECVVPETLRLGPEGTGALLLHESTIWERGCLFAYFVGAMERSLTQCVEHVRTRQQPGEGLESQQAISHRLVDMRVRLEAARLLLLRAGDLHRKGKPSEEAIAMSKLFIAEAAVQSGLDAVEIFGPAGICSTTGVDSLLRDAVPSRIVSGTAEIQRSIVARAMGLP